MTIVKGEQRTVSLELEGHEWTVRLAGVFLAGYGDWSDAFNFALMFADGVNVH